MAAAGMALASPLLTTDGNSGTDDFNFLRLWVRLVAFDQYSVFTFARLC